MKNKGFDSLVTNSAESKCTNCEFFCKDIKSEWFLKCMLDDYCIYLKKEGD